MNIRYRVELSQSERDQLKALLSGGKHPARKLKRAQILLAADAAASDAEIAARVVVGGSTVYRTKRRFVAGNLDWPWLRNRALEQRASSRARRKPCKETLMNIRYRVELSQSECDQLAALLSGGKHRARKLKRAQILLAADAGASDAQIAAQVVVGGSTVYRTKQRFVEGNLELALAEAPRAGARRKLSGKEEVLLIATACSNPPPGRAR